MRRFKKFISSIFLCFMILSLIGCSSNKLSDNPTLSDDSSDNNSNQSSIEATTLTVWSVNEIHTDMWTFGEAAYNKKHPDAPINVQVEILPNAEMHNKLLIALQSGTGAPDVADINLNFYSNFTSKDCQLVPLNDIVDKVLLLPSFVRNQTETFVHRLPELLPTEFDKLSQSAFFYNNPFISLIAVAIVTVSAILSCFDNRSVFQNVSA